MEDKTNEKELGCSCCDHDHNRKHEHEHEHEHEHDHKHKHGHMHGCGCCCCGEDEHEHGHGGYEIGGCGCHGDDDDNDAEHSAKDIVIFAIAGVLMIFAFLLAHGILLKNLPAAVWIVTSLAVYAYYGIPIIINMVKDFLHKSFFTENTLMAVATIGALCLGEFYEAAAVMFLYSLGEYLSDLAFDNSKKKISLMLDMSEKTVRVLENGKWTEKDPDDVEVGAVISLHAGEKVSLDGVISSGGANFDTSGITGESLPVYAGEGDTVSSGYICIDGSVEMTVTKPYGESVASKLADAVTEAGKRKSKNEKFIRSFAKIYTPAMMGLAAVIFALGAIISGDVAQWLTKALTVLVISCPCALVLSIPLTYFTSIGVGAKKGIMYKGGEAVDNAAKICAVAFDKTGTLTEAKIRTEEIKPACDRDEFIKTAIGVLSRSSHPLASAFCADNAGKEGYEAAESHETAGKGTEALLHTPAGDVRAIFGSARYLHEEYPDITFEKETETCIYGAANGKYIGVITFSDTPKANAKEAVSELKKLGASHLEILSGDKSAAVKRLAEKVGITKYSAELLPQDKLDRFEKIYAENRKNGSVAYVGDGLNDSPVIIRSDVGFAMGKGGAALSARAADIVIVNDDIENVPTAVKIAKKTRKIVIENIAFSLGIKALIMLICLIATPVMELAVLADVGVTLLAVLNCARIK